MRRRSSGSCASRPTAVHPLLRRLGQEAGFAVADHLDVNADGVGHDRQAGRHVLQRLQAALAAAPIVVGNPADAHVGRGDFRRLVRFGPRTGDDRQRIKAQKAVANEL